MTMAEFLFVVGIILLTIALAYGLSGVVYEPSNDRGRSQVAESRQGGPAASYEEAMALGSVEADKALVQDDLQWMRRYLANKRRVVDIDHNKGTDQSTVHSTVHSTDHGTER
jgi:hypothetical protein